MNRRAAPARWVLAYTSAVAGDATYFVVLTWAAAEAGGPLSSGLILATGAIPRALLMLPGGVLADRVNPRRLVIGTDAARCAVMLAAAALGAVLGLLPGWLFAVAVVFGIVDAIFMPAVGAMPAWLVPASNRKRLQAWRIAGLRVSNIVGPAVGGVLITLGVTAAFVAIAALFAVSVALLISVRLQPKAADVSMRTHQFSVRSTVARLRRHGVGRLVLATALADIPFSGPVAIAIVLLVHQRQWPAVIAGGTLSAFSLGGLAASLACAALPPRALGKTTLTTSTLSTAALLCGLALVPTAWAAIMIGAAMGITSGVTMVLCHGQIQQTTPSDLLGRVTALLTLLTLGVSPLLYAGAGTIAATIGIAAFFYAAALITLIAATGLAITHFEPTKAAA